MLGESKTLAWGFAMAPHRLRALVSNIFINIHEYANLIMKVLCLNIQLVPSLKASDELLLRYEYFCRDIPILKKRIMRCHGNHAISHSSNRFNL